MDINALVTKNEKSKEVKISFGSMLYFEKAEIEITL
jgi:hypothetical protein